MFVETFLPVRTVFLFLVFFSSLDGALGSEGVFFGVEPTAEPQLLAPDLLRTPLVEYNGTFSPDGKAFYYTTYVRLRGMGLITFTTMNDDGSWSLPVVASFSGRYSEYDPIFSPDGQRLYFSSRRPTPDDVKSRRNNVWYVERKGGGWGEPVFVPLTDRGNTYNSITRSGVLYFNTWSTGEMFTATESDRGYDIQKLPAPVNSEGNYDGDPFISPDGDYLIFRRDRGEGTLGRGDLFIAFNIDGEWTEPENLGAPINSRAHEMCPAVTLDGKMFIFSSSRLESGYEIGPRTPIETILNKHDSDDNGAQNLYYTSTDFIEELRAKHL